MILYNYNKILSDYNFYIEKYAKRIAKDRFEDYSQEIKIFVFQHLIDYNIEKASLLYYIKMLIKTKYRRLIYDKKQQETFEDSFISMFENKTEIKDISYNYDKFVSTIVTNLKTQNQISIFYAILYNVNRHSYREISKFLNMSYSSFINNLKFVKIVILKVAKDMNII